MPRMVVVIFICVFYFHMFKGTVVVAPDGKFQKGWCVFRLYIRKGKLFLDCNFINLYCIFYCCLSVFFKT